MPFPGGWAQEWAKEPCRGPQGHDPQGGKCFRPWRKSQNAPVERGNWLWDERTGAGRCLDPNVGAGLPVLLFSVEFWGSGTYVPVANTLREGRKIPFETLSSWDRLCLSQGKEGPWWAQLGLRGQPGQLPSAHPGPLLERLWSCFSCILKCVYRVCYCTSTKLLLCQGTC